MSRPSTSYLLPPRKPWMPGIADKFTQSAQTAMAGHDEGTCMPTDAPGWSLHSRLKEDTIDIGDLPLCRVLVIKDAHYPWLLLVPRRPDIVEIIDLDEVEQGQLMTEISRVARALKE